MPGGFGDRGTDGKIEAIAHARKEGVPFLGICLGMQLAVVEFARNELGMPGATSSEFDKSVVGTDDEVMHVHVHVHVHVVHTCQHVMCMCVS